MRLEPRHILLASVVLMLCPASCVSPPTFEVGACPSEEQLPPGHTCFSIASSGYLGELHTAAMRAANAQGFEGQVLITYDEGPSVSSVCYREFDDVLSEDRIERVAQAMGNVRPPRTLQCLVGHRAKHSFKRQIEVPLHLQRDPFPYE